MPKRWPTTSAVWPMFNSVMGSVSPRSSPMIGLKYRGRVFSSAMIFAPMPLAPARPANQRTPGIGPDQRRVAQRLGAAGQDHVGDAFADVAIGGVDRLHAGAAIDLHGEGDHGFAHAEPKCRDARRVHLVGDDIDAAEDDLVERVGRKGLPRQQRPAALHGEIDRRERPGTGARLQERRPAAVDDKDRSRHQLAALCSPSSWKN